jgi:hypothetical protein
VVALEEFPATAYTALLPLLLLLLHQFVVYVVAAKYAYVKLCSHVQYSCHWYL